MLHFCLPKTAAIAVLFLMTPGCSQTATEPDGLVGPEESRAIVAVASNPGAGVSHVEEVSVEEAEAFARQMLAAVAEDDKVQFAKLLNTQKLLDRAWVGIPVSPTLRSQFDRGFIETFAQQAPVLREITQMVSGGGDYALLRIRERERCRTTLFRALMPESGVNYHEFRLRKAEDGTVYADDMFVMMSAEWLSETLNRLCVALAADSDQGWFDKLVGKQQLFVKHREEINRMSTAMQQRNPQEVLRIFASLPVELKTEKNVLLIRFRAASESNNDEAYLAAMRDIRKYHPADPCCAMMLIDYDLMTKQYEKALSGIELIDQSVGGDPYSDILRAGVYMEQANFDEAKKAGLRVIETQPVLQAGFWTLINLENKQKNYGEVVKWIESLAEHAVYSPEDFIATPDFADFVKSEEFATWQLRFEQNF